MKAGSVLVIKWSRTVEYTLYLQWIWLSNTGIYSTWLHVWVVQLGSVLLILSSVQAFFISLFLISKIIILRAIIFREVFKTI